MSLVAYEGSSDSEEEDSSTILKSEKEQDVRKLLSVIPAPNRGKKQPVRLLLASGGRVSTRSVIRTMVTMTCMDGCRAVQMRLTVMMTSLQPKGKG